MLAAGRALAGVSNSVRGAAEHGLALLAVLETALIRQLGRRGVSRSVTVSVTVTMTASMHVRHLG
jgi:hypothetical protein